MGSRNIPCISQYIDLEMDQQGQGYLHPEQNVYMGGPPNFPPPDVQMAVSASGNPNNLETHSLADPYDGGMFYAIPQYGGVQHHNPHPVNLDLGVGTASGLYFPYMANPSSSAPVNQVPIDQLPSSSNYAPHGLAIDEYGRNYHYMDNARSSYKRKTAETIPGNFHYLNAPSSSSPLVAPMNTRHPDGLVEHQSFPHPQYQANGAPSIREVGSHRTSRNSLGATAMEPVPMHNHNHYFQGSFMGPSFPPAMTDARAPSWGQAQPLPHMHGGNVADPRQIVHRSPPPFINSPPLNIRHHNYHQPLPPVQAMRGNSVNVHPQAAAVSHSLPSSYVPQHHPNPSADGLEIGSRQTRYTPPAIIRSHRSREGVVPLPSQRHHNLPYLRVLAPDGVALLEFSEYYEDADNFNDNHRDMRLDIEDMSYEELLALGERIGNVSTGLPEEEVSRKLKTKAFTPSTYINLEEEAPAVDLEAESCIICQEEYKSREKIGTLDCGHDYHADCLKKWLVVKNVCPICKSEALAT